MSATPREGLYTAIQTLKIYLKSAVVGVADILGIIDVGSKLHYDAQPTFNDPEDIPSVRWVLGQISSSSSSQIAFAAGASNPIIIFNWDTLYAPTFGTGKFRVQYIIATAPDVIQEVEPIITRTKDAGTNSFQDFVTFDFGLVAHDGQIIIEPSNAPLP